VIYLKIVKYLNIQLIHMKKPIPSRRLAEKFTCSGGIARALALAIQDDFGDLPNCGKASKRDLRPWLKSFLTAGKIYLPTGGGSQTL